MSKIYKDALSDAKKLREIAEQNAKNKIIEAVAPRIKQLIENELMDDYDEEDIEFFDEEEEMEAADGVDVEAVDDLVSDMGAALPSEDPAIAIGGEPVEATPTEFSFEKDGKQVKVSVTVEAVANEILKNFVPVGKYKMKKNSLGFLISALSEAKTSKEYKAILKEIKNIQKKLIIMSEAGDESSRTKLSALNLLLKENTRMRRKEQTSRRLNENAWWLTEQEDDELGDDELDLGDELEGEEGEEGEEAEVDVAAVESAVEDLAAALGMSLSEEEPEEGDEEAEEGVEDEFELDLEEADNADEGEDTDEDDLVEISEAMLRREIARMSNSRPRSRRQPRSRRSSNRLAESRRRRLARRRRRLAEMGDPLSAKDQFGGADEVIEVDREDLLNALADELGGADGAELSVDGSGVATDGNADQFGGGKSDGPALAERRALRRYRKQLAEANKQTAAAQKELKESNLFNAKLLYVNKLMQSYDLNAKQQRAIVEALDNAKTLREAKLLYTTLTESLKKGRSTKGGALTESASRTGSASKSVRSSAPANNGSELGRWAVLAGIK